MHVFTTYYIGFPSSNNGKTGKTNCWSSCHLTTRDTKALKWLHSVDRAVKPRQRVFLYRVEGSSIPIDLEVEAVLALSDWWKNMKVWRKSSIIVLKLVQQTHFLVSNLWYRHGTIYSIFATLCLHQHFRLLVGGFSGVSPVLSVLSGLFLSSKIVTNPNIQSWVWELREFYPHWTMHQAPGSSTWTPHFSLFFSQKLVQKTRNCQILTLTMNNNKGSAMTDSHPNRQPVG